MRLSHNPSTLEVETDDPWGKLLARLAEFAGSV